MTPDASQPDQAQNFPTEGEAFATLWASEAFAEFELRIEAGLEMLEARWMHLAAPNAGQRQIRNVSAGRSRKAK